MPNATRKVCDYPNCTRGPLDANQLPTPYITPPDLQRREEVSEDLRVHVDSAHMMPIKMAEAEFKKIEAEARRIEARAREIEAETAREVASRDPQPQNNAPETNRNVTEKRNPLPRPQIELDVTESDG